MHTCLFWIEGGLEELSGGVVKISVKNASTGACKYTRFLFDTCRFLSAWIIVAFSVERSIAVWLPMRAAILLTRKRRLMTAISLLAFAMISNVPILVYFDIFDDGVRRKCHYVTAGMAVGQKFALLFGNLTGKSFLLPCVLICVLSAVIVAGILRHRHTAVTSTKNWRREIRAAVNLLAVAAVYFVFNMPYVVIWTLYNYINFFVTFEDYPISYKRALLNIGDFCTSLTVMNYALNFLIYCSSLEFYRAEMRRLLPCVALLRRAGGKEVGADKKSTRVTLCAAAQSTSKQAR